MNNWFNMFSNALVCIIGLHINFYYRGRKRGELKILTQTAEKEALKVKDQKTAKATNKIFSTRDISSSDDFFSILIFWGLKNIRKMHLIAN